LPMPEPFVVGSGEVPAVALDAPLDTRFHRNLRRA
jgi:hypothetical protein